MAAKNVLRRAMLYGKHSFLPQEYPIIPLTDHHSPRLLSTLPRQVALAHSRLAHLRPRRQRNSSPERPCSFPRQRRNRQSEPFSGPRTSRPYQQRGQRPRPSRPTSRPPIPEPDHPGCAQSRHSQRPHLHQRRDRPQQTQHAHPTDQHPRADRIRPIPYQPERNLPRCAPPPRWADLRRRRLRPRHVPHTNTVVNGIPLCSWCHRNRSTGPQPHQHDGPGMHGLQVGGRPGTAGE